MSIDIDHYLGLDPSSPEGRAFCAGFLYANKDRLDQLDRWLDTLTPDQRRAVLVMAAEHALLGEPVQDLAQFAKNVLRDPMSLLD